MALPKKIPTLIVGAGQAGLSMSRLLTEAGREHLVVDRRATLGGGWQDRWDSFRLVTPGWSMSLPGQPYDGPDPDGFMPRDEIVQRVAGYAELVGAPLALETEVQRATPKDGGGFAVETNDGALLADEIVVATGSFHGPRIPAMAAGLSGEITQLHSHEYRNPAQLPPGAVLVVGTGQTGVQLAEELVEAGRHVYLAVGSTGWAPRRYRGRDVFGWLLFITRDGPMYDINLPTAETLPNPAMRLAGPPQLTGHHGGHDVSLRRMAAESDVTLLGHLEGIEGTQARIAPDLNARLARAEGFFDQMLRTPVDTFIERSGLDAPPAADPTPFPYDPPERTELDLRAEGISTVLWTTGYRMDHSWIAAPIVDEQGIPRQKRGVSEIPGLYFLGLLWQHTQASATLFGPTLDAPFLADRMGLPPSSLFPARPPS